MVKIRLRRPGKSIKGRTHQKIVVTERSWARESKFIDQIGYYDPSRDLLKIDTEKYKQWIEKGAQPSETVASLFKGYGKPKKEKKKKTFRPGEKQDHPKPAEEEAATTEAEKKEEAPKEPVTTEAPQEKEAPQESKEEKPKKEEAATTEAPKKEETAPESEEEKPNKEKKPNKEENK